jgi:hypothetical protein
MRPHLVFLLLLWLNTAFAGGGDKADEGPWWVGHLITALAALIGALMIVWQIGRQRRNEIEMQTENFRTQLRLQIFQEFSVRLGSTSDALIEAGNCALTLHMKAEAQPPTDPTQTLIDLSGKAALELGNVVCLIEKYLIIHPDMEVFRLAFSSAAFDMSESFHRIIGHLIECTSDKADFGQLLHKLCDEYHSTTLQANGFVSDLQTELQLIFLGQLFPGQPVRRRPSDPSQRVVTLESAAIKGHRDHFLRNTAWGKRMVEDQMAVHRHFHHEPNLSFQRTASGGR